MVDDAREHYVDVGKSKLRTPKTAALGPQYRGSRVSRDALTDDGNNDDPFGRGFEEEDSDEDDGGLVGGGGSSSEDEDAEDENTGTSDTDLSAEDATDLKPKADAMVMADLRTETRRAFANDQKTVSTSLAQSTKVDVERGRAVKQQQAAFDSLLNARIKLQKSLVGVNTIVGIPADEVQFPGIDTMTAIAEAERAAFNLWSSLNDFREDLSAARAGVKRKRKTFTDSTSTADLWKHMQSQEESSLPHRNVILQRWTKKAKMGTALPERGLINGSANQATIVDALQEHLSNRERLLKRVHTPRSCAPLQLGQNVSEDEKIYDDADFYGLLLKELLEQKSQDSVAASGIDLNFNLRHEAKTKKIVDTKASKGRKLRYTVHEKLQNFMAPEDRSTWGERQTDELFRSLFGQNLGLGEGLDEEAEDEVDAEEAGLMLFRS